MAKYDNITADLGLYEVNDFMGQEAYGIAVQLYENKIPYARLTVSFGEFIGLKNAAYVDTNNFPDALDFIESKGLGKDTGFIKASGFCEYPLVLFEEGFLASLNPEMYQKYSDRFDELMPSEEFDEPGEDER